MINQKVLLVGYGDIGRRLGQRLAANYQVTGLRRTPTAAAPVGVELLAGDIREPSVQQKIRALAPAVVVISLTPDSYSAESYASTYVEGARGVIEALQGVAVARVLWVSSTSVYHQHDGEPVDETSPAQPASGTAQQLLLAEQLLQQSGLPVTVVRFSGIYGPGRNRLLEQVRQGVGSPAEPVHYTNRIHADDCAGVLAHLIEKQRSGQALDPIYLGTDSCPVPLAEVKQGLAEMMELPSDWVREMAPARGGKGKQCSNQRLLASGYAFQYPSWREGYAQILTEVKGG